MNIVVSSKVVNKGNSTFLYIALYCAYDSHLESSVDLRVNCSFATFLIKSDENLTAICCCSLIRRTTTRY